jgi:hypothetical protein
VINRSRWPRPPCRTTPSRGWHRSWQPGIGLLITGLALLVAVVAGPGLVSANCLPPAERHRIEAVLGVVAQDSATFIRNGRAYRGATAAQFLRGKWRAREADVCSAEDFIAKVASISSTTGTPYLVRLHDGREVPAAAFFRTVLADLTRGEK